MSLAPAITLIVVLDAALIGLLAFVMSRASRLLPHASPAIEEIPKAQSSARPAHRRDTHPAKRGRVGAEVLASHS